MKQLQALTAFNTFLLVVLIFLHLELRNSVNGQLQVVSGLSTRIGVPIEQMQSQIQQADQLAETVRKRFDAVRSALEAANPPSNFQQIDGVIAAPMPSSAPMQESPPTVPHFAAETDLSPLDITVTSRRMEGELETISGTAKDNQSIAVYMKQLSATGRYQAVDLQESRQTAEGRSAFVLVARLAQ